MSEPRDIIDFWFRGLDDSVQIKKNEPPVKLWFSSTPPFDREIKEKFEADLIAARDGKLSEWEKSYEGLLALILLFDQFSRNIYRGTPQAYATDALALKLSLKIIEEQLDVEYQRIFRLFVYMPLMHAEDVKIQELSVQKFESLVEEAKDFSSQNAPYYEWNLKYARQHCETILNFGKFIHRYPKH